MVLWANIHLHGNICIMDHVVITIEHLLLGYRDNIQEQKENTTLCHKLRSGGNFRVKRSFIMHGLILIFVAMRVVNDSCILPLPMLSFVMVLASSRCFGFVSNSLTVKSVYKLEDLSKI